MPIQLLGQNTGCGSVSLSFPREGLTDLRSGSILAQGALFYSNNPETVTNQIADRGIYLNHAVLRGGPIQVFYWHANHSGGMINSAIYLRNPNSSDVIVTVSARGIVPLQAASSVEAWFQYYTPDEAETVTVPANGDAFLHRQAVPMGQIFGGVSNISIGGPGSMIPLDVYDIAYESPGRISLGALAAPDGTSRRRGTGNGYQTTVDVDVDLLALSQSGPRGVTIGSPNDPIGSPGGTDLVAITDAGTGQMAPLGGNYGVQYAFAWTMSNSDTVARTFTLYGGNYNTGGATGTNFVINYAPGGRGLGGCRRPSPPLLPGHYLAFLQDTLEPLGRTTYNFRLCTVGGFSYPLTLVAALTR
jgi:hypothetical protein